MYQFVTFAADADAPALTAYLQAMAIVRNKMLRAGERSAAVDIASLIEIGSEILRWIKHGPFQTGGSHA